MPHKTKELRRQYIEEYNKKNAHIIKIKTRKYYLKNKKRITKTLKLYKLNNPEKYKDIFYCYDDYTYISIQSLMCNTDTIIIPSKKSIEEFQNGYELNKYLAYGIDDLPRAKSIRHEFFDHLNKIEQETQKQLDKFIEICYDYFK